jgi:hypothetical protein
VFGASNAQVPDMGLETGAHYARPGHGEVRCKTPLGRTDCRLTLAAIVARTAIVIAATTAPAQAERAPFAQAVIDAAMSEPDLRYAPSEACPGPAYSTLKQIGTSYCVLKPAQAFYFLALTAYLDPGARASDHQLVWRRVVELFNILTSDGNGPQVARPLDGWSDGPIAQAILLIKHTPVVWRALGPAGRAKADWLMAAMALLGNWGFNDANDWLTGIGLAGNFAKTNNPNFTQGYLGVMMACILYFGQAGCDSLFTNFDYDQYIAAFETFNWQNILSPTSWLAAIDVGGTHYTMKVLMENGGDLTKASPNLGSGAGVRLPFKYLGIELTGDNADPHAVTTLFTYESIGQDPPSEPPDPDNLLSNSQPKPMYYWAVASRKAAPDGVAQIIDATQSPVEGKLGMGYEFNSNDSAGIRSDALYAFEGWLNNLITRATLQALGVWDHRQMDLVDRRMTVGGRDLLYKLEHGYHGRALNANGPNTHYRDVCVVEVVGPDFVCDPTDLERQIEGTPLEKGFVYDREIWDKLVERPHRKAQSDRESGVLSLDGGRDNR